MSPDDETPSAPAEEVDFAALFEASLQPAVFEIGQLLQGVVVLIARDVVFLDVGGKGEATMDLPELQDEDGAVTVEVGATVEGVVVSTAGGIKLSHKLVQGAATRRQVEEAYRAKLPVEGRVENVNKGGYEVRIGGQRAFCPLSQIDTAFTSDPEVHVGQVYTFRILEYKEEGEDLVVSRRALIEEEEREQEADVRKTIIPGADVPGRIVSVRPYGAFVDLGGLDGLLHITDMSWGRIGHPSEMTTIDQEIEVQILNIDYEKEKIALGLKQKTPSPWENVAKKYPVDSVIEGTVVNVMSYGAFVKLEDGIEGLVHISEMSWTRRINHPNELVSIGEAIEVVVLGINEEKQEISLGMKQTQANPWDKVADNYPPDSFIKGRVRNLTNYGAFIEIEEGIDGLLHVSDMSWTRKVSHPSEVLEKGQEIECKVLSVDQQRRRIALGIKQLSEDPWESDIPAKYQPGQTVMGTVTKLTNFGVFVGLENGLEGLLHISELSDEKVENPEAVVKEGEEIEVRILRVDVEERKIGLSRRSGDIEELQAQHEPVAVEETTSPQKSAEPLKGGVGDSSGPLIQTAVKEADTSTDEE